MSVGKTIFTQLGGNKFAVMTGAKISTSNHGLVAVLPRKQKGHRVNHVEVKLNERDLYTIAFNNYSKSTCNLEHILVCEDVCVDNLIELFETNTGYLVRL